MLDYGNGVSVYMPLPNVVLDICELVNNVKICSQQQLHLPTDLLLGLLTSYKFFFYIKIHIQMLGGERR